MLIIILFIFSQLLFGQDLSKIRDSIIQLRNLSNDVNTTSKDKIIYAKKAYDLSLEINQDTTLLISGRGLSYAYALDGDFENYQRFNHKNLVIASRLKDTFALAIVNQHLAYYHYNYSQHDSAYFYYYKSLKFFTHLGDIQNQIDILRPMADMQESEKDYAGSEKNAVQALKLLAQLPESNENLQKSWGLNSLLALISERLSRSDRAIIYYNKSIDIAKRIDGGRSRYLHSINNLAYTIESQGKLEEALNHYEEVASEPELFEVMPDLYVVVTGNIARVKFMMDAGNANESKRTLLRALYITDSIQDDYNKMGVNGFLADIYYKTKDKDSAIYYSKKAYELAKELNSNTERLQALKLLGQLESGTAGVAYLNEHIRLSDSLLKNERNARDKFTRIEFETDEIIAEKEQISKERLIFLLASIGLLVTLILIYIIVTQRSKNKALRFSKMQQEANEEIYNLMLAQQDKVEEGRTDEKKRISKELHDGVLGKLFGTRLSLDSLNLVHTDEAVKNRSKYIDGLQSIETEIRKISHDLSNDFVTGSSFTDIVSTLIETQTKAYQLGYAFDHDDDIDWDAVPNKTKMNIYRMLQETMQNIYKHAQATKIIINFKLNNDLILLTVEDDGIGFNVDRAKKGIGVKNINARAKEMGGYVNIKSEIGSGTLIEISIPKGVNT